MKEIFSVRSLIDKYSLVKPQLILLICLNIDRDNMLLNLLVVSNYITYIFILIFMYGILIIL